MQVWLVLGLGLLASGCDRCEAPNFVAASDRRITYIGRFHPRPEGGMRFAWPGSRIEARFRGGTLRMQLTDIPVEDETRETDWFAVRIDGGAPRVLHVAEGLQTYTLAEGLSPGVHRVEIVKRTEAEVGTATFHGFELDRGQLLDRAPEPPARHIELIGDSITAGFGNEGSSERCRWDAALENNAATYGAFAAHELGASYSAIAWSGKGLLRNYDPREPDTMPALYERVIPTDPRSPLATADPRTQVVVVNLGTNDFFTSIPDKERFSEALRALVARLRGRYPKALIILALGPILADDFPHPQSRTLLRGWLSEVRDQAHAAGDTKIDLIEQWYDPAEGLGCESHPNVKTHARLGKELAEAIRKLLGEVAAR